MVSRWIVTCLPSDILYNQSSWWCHSSFGIHHFPLALVFHVPFIGFDGQPVKGNSKHDYYCKTQATELYCYVSC